MVEQKGMWIAFEGNDGAGKSTLIPLFGNYLRGLKLEVVETREPGGNPFSEKLRKLIFDEEIGNDPMTQLLLFVAARRRNILSVVMSTLMSGGILLSDRSEGSTMAYQGYQFGLPLNIVRYINTLGTEGIKPDLTVLLDIETETAQKRKAKVGDSNHFDEADIGKWLKRREGFLDLAKEQNWIIIDANQEPEEVVLRDIIQAVHKKMIIPGLPELPSLQS